MHIDLPLLSDMHVHLRQGAMLRDVAHWTGRCCAHALVMPNTVLPVTTAADVMSYQTEVWAALRTCTRCKPLMTFKLLPSTTADMVTAMRGLAVAGKLYPEGVTTHSSDGISRRMLERPLTCSNFTDALGAMEQADMVLCLHGEMPGEFCLDREVMFREFVRWVLLQYPKLKVVWEHITDRRSVSFVKRWNEERLAATITAHHLRLMLDDVIGDKLSPHNFCKPVAKLPADRLALLRAATSGDPCFFLGSDSAPHPIGNKECAAGCAGVFTAPLLPELLTTIFEEKDALKQLAAFTSINGNRFYGLPQPTETVRLEREPWQVSELCGGAVPFLAGQILPWRIV